MQFVIILLWITFRSGGALPYTTHYGTFNIWEQMRGSNDNSRTVRHTLLCVVMWLIWYTRLLYYVRLSMRARMFARSYWGFLCRLVPYMNRGVYCVPYPRGARFSDQGLLSVFWMNDNRFKWKSNLNSVKSSQIEQLTEQLTGNECAVAHTAWSDLLVGEAPTAAQQAIRAKLTDGWDAWEFSRAGVISRNAEQLIAAHYRVNTDDNTVLRL